MSSVFCLTLLMEHIIRGLFAFGNGLHSHLDEVAHFSKFLFLASIFHVNLGLFPWRWRYICKGRVYDHESAGVPLLLNFTL